MCQDLTQIKVKASGQKVCSSESTYVASIFINALKHENVLNR